FAKHLPVSDLYQLTARTITETINVPFCMLQHLPKLTATDLDARTKGYKVLASLYNDWRQDLSSLKHSMIINSVSKGWSQISRNCISNFMSTKEDDANNLTIPDEIPYKGEHIKWSLSYSKARQVFCKNIINRIISI
ncbi:hypothetical protein L9F63_001568, partial [Diploptera punctata]